MLQCSSDLSASAQSPYPGETFISAQTLLMILQVLLSLPHFLVVALV